MEKVENLSSKIHIINGEKVFYAREIMETLGYKKRERFEGAIYRALKDDINGDLLLDIIKTKNNNTGGRPKIDFMLTYKGLFKVLDKCDKSKEPIDRAKIYVQNNLKENYFNKSGFVTRKLVIQKFIQIKSSLDLFYIFMILIILISTGVLYFFSNYSSYFIDLNYKKNDVPVFVNTGNLNVNEQSLAKQIVENEIKNQEKNINIIQKDVNIHNFKKDLEKYINNYNNPQFYSKNQLLNNRTDFGYTLTGVNLIESYFTFGNNKLYRESCSLLSSKLCLSASKGNLYSFSKFFDNTKSGFEDINVKKVDKKNSKGEDIYCVKYKYKLKNDSSDKYITEVFNYSVSSINGIEQIEQRFCESIDKSGLKRNCPFELKNYYCEKIFENK